jgi:hypothetical protein
LVLPIVRLDIETISSGNSAVLWFCNNAVDVKIKTTDIKTISMVCR